MDEMQQLLAIEALKRLRAQYFYRLDTKDWTGFGSLFAPDAVMSLPELPDGEVVGSEHITEFVSRSTIGVTSVHHGHTPQIDLTSPTTASGIWAMEDMLIWGDDSVSPGQKLHGYGYYHDEYVKADTWRFKHVTLLRLRVDMTPEDPN